MCLGCENRLFLQVGASLLLFMEEAEKQAPGKKVGDQGAEQEFDLEKHLLTLSRVQLCTLGRTVVSLPGLHPLAHSRDVWVCGNSLLN